MDTSTHIPNAMRYCLLGQESPVLGVLNGCQIDTLLESCMKCVVMLECRSIQVLELMLETKQY